MTTMDRDKLEEWKRIAGEADVSELEWFAADADVIDEVWAVSSSGNTVSTVAQVNPLAEWSDETALRWKRHIGASSPKAVLALISRVEELERERDDAIVEAGLARRDLQYAEARLQQVGDALREVRDGLVASRDDIGVDDWIEIADDALSLLDLKEGASVAESESQHLNGKEGA